jgi:hypothetical protein
VEARAIRSFTSGVNLQPIDGKVVKEKRSNKYFIVKDKERTSNRIQYCLSKNISYMKIIYINYYFKTIII